MEKVWKASAPSNIALIKYMGKLEGEKNQAINPTISYTLNHLLTDVHLSLSADEEDHFEPLPHSNIQLGGPQQKRFLDFLKFIKSQYHCDQGFVVKSKNNFPSDCGLASSASSFAALTQATIYAICELQDRKPPDLNGMVALSRQGSGSSCRSFFGPWVLWSDSTVSKIDIPFRQMYHMVFIVNRNMKKVSSREAHKRVVSSSLFEGRQNRARVRMGHLVEALQIKNWKTVYEICWSEFWDMHALFETSLPSFGYMQPETLKILNWIRDFWKVIGDGPLVTMDAGPNIHFLFRLDQKEMMETFYKKWSSSFDIIKS